MPLVQVLSDFRFSVAQCDNLIGNSHKHDAHGNFFLTEIDRQQITVAAFLNMYISWETFLECALAELMVGEPTISGRAPVKYVSPRDIKSANEFVVGIARYFDYANHDNVKKVVHMYFDGGYPFEPHISSIIYDLQDLRTIRNASAHISFTTQDALERLAQRLLNSPRPGITVYELLTAPDPRPLSSGTVFATYKDKLIVAAELISQG